MEMNSLSLLFPNQDRVTYQMISEETWHDLGMDALVKSITDEPQEIPMIR